MATAGLERAPSIPQQPPGQRFSGDSPSSLSLGNGLGGGLPSIGLRSVSNSGLPNISSFGGSLNLEELLGDVAHVAALHQQQQSQQPPPAFAFSAQQQQQQGEAKSSDEIWRSIHGGGGGSGGGALAGGNWSISGLTEEHGHSAARTGDRLGSGLPSGPSVMTNYHSGGAGLSALQQRHLSSGHTSLAAFNSLSSTGLSQGMNHMNMFSSGSTEVASHMAAALAARADPSWFPQLAGTGPLADAAAAAVVAAADARSQQWAAAARSGGRASGAGGSPLLGESHLPGPGFGALTRGQYPGGVTQGSGQHPLTQQQRGGGSLSSFPAPTGELNIGLPRMRSSGGGGSLDHSQYLDRRTGRGGSASPQYMQQPRLEQDTRATSYPSVTAYRPRQTSSPPSPPRFGLGPSSNGSLSSSPADFVTAHQAAAALAGGNSILAMAAGLAAPSPPAGSGGRSHRGGGTRQMSPALQKLSVALPGTPFSRPSNGITPSLATDGAMSLKGMPLIPPVSAPLETPSDVKPAVAGLSARERHKLTKGRTVEMDEKEQRDAKRKEANRESAARSRDKRLKLIADLEVEVQELKKKHTEFKEKVIENTVPKQLVLAAAQPGSPAPLRRASTDPIESELRIRRALVTENFDLSKIAAAHKSALDSTPEGGEAGSAPGSTGGSRGGSVTMGAPGGDATFAAGADSAGEARSQASLGLAAEPASRAEAAQRRAAAASSAAAGLSAMPSGADCSIAAQRTDSQLLAELDK